MVDPITTAAVTVAGAKALDEGVDAIKAEPEKKGPYTQSMQSAVDAGMHQAGAALTDRGLHALGLGQGHAQKRYLQAAYPGTLPSSHLGASGRAQSETGKTSPAMVLQSRELSNRLELERIRGEYAVQVAEIANKPHFDRDSLGFGRLGFDREVFERRARHEFPKMDSETLSNLSTAMKQVVQARHTSLLGDMAEIQRHFYPAMQALGIEQAQVKIALDKAATAYQQKRTELAGAELDAFADRIFAEIFQKEYGHFSGIVSLAEDAGLSAAETAWTLAGFALFPVANVGKAVGVVAKGAAKHLGPRGRQLWNVLFGKRVGPKPPPAAGPGASPGASSTALTVVPKPKPGPIILPEKMPPPSTRQVFEKWLKEGKKF